MRRLLPLFFLLLLLFAGCRPKGPVAIEYGQDICAFCKMIIADPRFGAEVITKTGKVYKFDSVECMVAHIMYDLGSRPPTSPTSQTPASSSPPRRPTTCKAPGSVAP